jgi:hypothetical protein
MANEAQPLPTAKEISLIMSHYRPDDMYRALIYGVSGSGKTYSLRTARRPVHVDSFDPNGTQSIDDVVRTEANPKGYIYADTRYELEDPLRPSAWKLYDKEIHRRFREGYFHHLGTYATDLTSMASAALNQTLAESNRAGGVPQQNDWYPQMVKLENAVRFLMSLPCDVILLGHVDHRKDEVTGKVTYYPMITGKLVVRIPLQFSEIYVAQTKETADGLRYAWLTQAAGNYTARTRLGKNGKFDKYEQPDFKALLKKAGKDFEDKPY